MVALETTVLTHGLPYPENIELANSLAEIVQAEGAIPALIGVMEGEIVVGMTREEVEKLAVYPEVKKVSLRDFAPLVAKSGWGGTTVAGTMWAAQKAGIKVFATGGIGGVHRTASSKQTFDISTDLSALGRYAVIVVCAGAKSILDLAATLEVLESNGVPVVGYQTDEFPAFYARKSGGLKTSERVETPAELANFARIHWELGFESAVLATVPVPESDELPYDEMEEMIQSVTMEAERKGVHGQALTPYILRRLTEVTKGASLRANLSLLKNNAKIAALTAIEWVRNG